MNNFPAMTEAQRQELIADCNINISNLEVALRCAEINGWKQTAAEQRSRLLRQQIALAALTAEPEYYFRKRSDGGRERPIHRTETEDSRKGSWSPLYNAPPAPVLRAPDEVFEKAYNQHLNGLLCGDNNKTAAKQFLQDCINGQPAPAPVLKPVEVPRTDCIGWVRDTIHEHDEKWKQAIRAAGYEVKQ